ncbi:uncharacterized protein LOC143082833 isoform X9 [Mytilus galloprovincialis]|uniref:uncharacterized protein LOC143082833 isoform X9 n=1 Tax=Mytilus galloprovincialis TaxID=29158 RepID=UPI003F7CA19C
MNQYQKVYMNQIHSSSLLGQLAQMWKSQMLCDALIRTGNVTTKAHRVVLVAACPMLQSMDNASVGSHLEVRLAADIKQEAVNSFLQYLYEGFMMLSEENCKDVEKVARLLQVDSVTKCCIDFYNCLQKKTGVPVYSNTQYKYSSADLLEFRHVRTTDLQKTLHERMMKRAAADSVRPTSPSGKRQRMQQQRPPSPNIDLAMFGQKADDTLSMTHSYMGNTGNQAAGEPWERVPRIGAIHSQRPSHPKPGVIEIVEDSLEILQTQPPDKDGNKSAPPIIQKSLAISVSSQLNSSQDVHVVNVNDSSSHPTAAGDGPIMSTGRDSITVSPLTVMPGTSSLSSSSASSPLTKDPHKSTMDKDMLDKQTYAKKLQSSLDHQSSTPQRGLFPVSMSPANMSPINQVKKSFAAGSASQAASMSQSHDSPTKRTSTSAGNEMERPQSSDQGKDLGTKNKVDDRSASNSTDMAPDLSIVKVEPTGEAGLDMYVDVPEESMIQAQQREQREHDDESDLELEEASGDWSRDEMSNEAAGGDQNNSWYIGQFKDEAKANETVNIEHPVGIPVPGNVETRKDFLRLKGLNENTNNEESTESHFSQTHYADRSTEHPREQSIITISEQIAFIDHQNRDIMESQLKLQVVVDSISEVVAAVQHDVSNILRLSVDNASDEVPTSFYLPTTDPKVILSKENPKSMLIGGSEFEMDYDQYYAIFSKCFKSPPTLAVKLIGVLFTEKELLHKNVTGKTTGREQTKGKLDPTKMTAIVSQINLQYPNFMMKKANAEKVWIAINGKCRKTTDKFEKLDKNSNG